MSVGRLGGEFAFAAVVQLGDACEDSAVLSCMPNCVNGLMASGALWQRLQAAAPHARDARRRPWQSRGPWINAFDIDPSTDDFLLKPTVVSTGSIATAIG